MSCNGVSGGDRLEFTGSKAFSEKMLLTVSTCRMKTAINRTIMKKDDDDTV